RQFYRLKARDDIENVRTTKEPSLQRRKYKRIAQEMRRITRGLQGDWRSFDHILDIAYGRKGKLRHELIEPFLSDPKAQVPPPIIPQMPNSRPPVYSPDLRALLTNVISRTTKPLRPGQLKKPSTLPPQADPASDEARLFGPLSKRREKNILHRYFKEEVRKVYPPFGVEVQNGKTLEEVGIRGGAGQGLNLRKDIEAIIGPVWKPPPLTRRERQALGTENPTSTESPPGRHPSRWLRRRYQSLLARLPILQFTPGQNPRTGRYEIERSNKALVDIYTAGGRLLPVAGAPQVAWYEAASSQPKAELTSKLSM
ncbi:hypothetical protein AN958_10854, partial [Leucoagaricus sp. SymC.cos]